jgi:hypothetical protein
VVSTIVSLPSSDRGSIRQSDRPGCEIQSK